MLNPAVESSFATNPLAPSLRSLAVTIDGRGILEITMDWYNGYNPNERNAMGRASAPSNAKVPPCAMCGDPNPPKMQTHAEDYSKPYRWVPPAAYPLCTLCHSRLHSRFDDPSRWKSFLQFLRRGWYGREVPSDALHRLTRLGEAYPWRNLPHDLRVRTSEHSRWWELLTMDATSKRSPDARAKG